MKRQLQAQKCSISSSMTRVALLALALAATCDAILPEIVDSGIGHILEVHSGATEPNRVFVEVEQLQEDAQPKPEDAFQQENTTTSTLSPSGTTSDQVTADPETNNVTAAEGGDLGNTIYRYTGCVADEDCGEGRYCLHDAHSPRCLPCRATDAPCARDEECCGGRLCVWGQCTPNATRGEPGGTCRRQADCGPGLCCALHAALLFPVCSAKPMERERCLGASNHLMEMLSWSGGDEGPREHCPCAGNLRCRHLGRGSMCLQGKDSSEEELTDTLYSEIDYII
ncbi:dickkopf-related protein 3a isoform X1 [Betta splendens]|uniref:Dickkopf-related protein 3a isoform X1 n=1 Tax=Betta splendens TaxID=158456 RepID=A0A6P7M001_BETSP|nr:dickkopf-related protein 3a isoform X1 [Betta splendens]